MRWPQVASPDERRWLTDSEAVWFWHPDADAKLAMMPCIALMTVARKPVTGKSAE